MKKNIFKSLIFIYVLVTSNTLVFGQSNNVATGSSSGPIFLLDPGGTYSTGITGPQLHVDGDVTFTSSQFNSHMIRFHSPNSETGHSLQASGKRADVRFDGTTLKLVTNNTGSVPTNENGIAIDTKGFVGFGQNTPWARIHLTDQNQSNYGAYFNSNSNGPTLYINHNSTGNSVPPIYTSSPSDHIALVVENTYNATSGGYTSGASFKARNVGTYSLSEGEIYNDFCTGLYAQASNNAGYKNFSSKGISAYGTNSKESYGVDAYGQSDVDENGIAYGVKGEAICTSSSGTSVTYGIYGRASGARDNWAGFFDGNVFTTGSYSSSDRKLKENIKEINNSLELILKLKPKTYNFIKNTDLNLPTGLRYGLIAQDLAEVLPELTKKVLKKEIRNKEGEVISEEIEFLSVDYLSIIPLLIGSIQEQQNTIEDLKFQIGQLKIDNKKIENITSDASVSKLNENILFQNNPNPFNSNTKIQYVLASNSKSASILIFNLNGELLKNYDLDTKIMTGELVIGQEYLQPGMYIYTLIVDNVAIDSKRMILNK